VRTRKPDPLKVAIIEMAKTPFRDGHALEGAPEGYALEPRTETEFDIVIRGPRGLRYFSVKVSEKY
jgi:hypothetical protein